MASSSATPSSLHSAGESASAQASLAEGSAKRVHALVTVGPTEEPIDSVRFLSNRSSGRMGLAIAAALSARGVLVTLLAGPLRIPLLQAQFARVRHFRTARDLEQLMHEELPHADLVVMAAAVADYRVGRIQEGKLRRTDEALTLQLEPVPDLLQATRASRRAAARIIGFALEPSERLEASARAKLERKDLYAIFANPLETMDAADVQGTLYLRDGCVHRMNALVSKDACAAWMMPHLLAGLL